MIVIEFYGGRWDGQVTVLQSNEAPKQEFFLYVRTVRPPTYFRYDFFSTERFPDRVLMRAKYVGVYQEGKK